MSMDRYRADDGDNDMALMEGDCGHGGDVYDHDDDYDDAVDKMTMILRVLQISP